MIKLNEFRPYFIIGGISTLIDWSVFTATTVMLHFYYPLALTCSFLVAGIFHYTANKVITFKCRSKQIKSQLLLFVCVATVSLLLSIGVMSVLIKWLGHHAVLARMMTTGIMLIPNFLLHKNLTFSKKIFA